MPMNHSSSGQRMEIKVDRLFESDTKTVSIDGDSVFYSPQASTGAVRS
jgi:hypothetical protein